MDLASNQGSEAACQEAARCHRQLMADRAYDERLLRDPSLRPTTRLQQISLRGSGSSCKTSGFQDGPISSERQQYGNRWTRNEKMVSGS